MNVQRSQEVLVQMPLNDIEAMEAMQYDIYEHYYFSEQKLSKGTNAHEWECLSFLFDSTIFGMATQ